MKQQIFRFPGKNIQVDQRPALIFFFDVIFQYINKSANDTHRCFKFIREVYAIIGLHAFELQNCFIFFLVIAKIIIANHHQTKQYTYSK